jgi:hypothetical protein
MDPPSAIYEAIPSAAAGKGRLATLNRMLAGGRWRRAATLTLALRPRAPTAVRRLASLSRFERHVRKSTPLSATLGGKAVRIFSKAAGQLDRVDEW